MVAIKLICLICKEEFWSSGFDHICYQCACSQKPIVYSNNMKDGENNLKNIKETKSDE